MTQPTITPIRVLLVDDHHTVLWGLEKLINGEKPRMEVVGKATNSTEAIELAEKVHPNIVLLDIDLGEQNGINAVPGLIARSKAKVLVLTGLRNSSVHDAAIRSGARGVVHKKDKAETILKAIEKVHEGEFWLDRTTTARIFVELSQSRGAPREDPAKAKVSQLTAREREVISALVTDPTANYGKIAEKLHISEHTVRNHITSIYDKLGIQNRIELFLFASKHELRVHPEKAELEPPSGLPPIRR
jgi:two-component system nitrate/nitrite response regulator NarL